MIKRIKQILSIALVYLFTLFIIGSFAKTKANSSNLNIIESGGWYETAYIEWTPHTDALGYNVFVKHSQALDTEYQQIDAELIREYETYWRADAVGLASGSYMMKVEAILDDELTVSRVSDIINVEAHDRSGFAFSSASKFKTGSGAYNDDGTLKPDAKVIYLTPATAKTVQLDVIVDSKGKKETGIGIAAILKLREKGHDQTPLAFRVIGKVTDENMSGQINKNGYIELKGNADYSEMNITIEGIGQDAYAYGWGILLRRAGNVEVRNLGLALFPDDAISVEGNNCNIWIHHNDIFYGKAGSDSDQAKGDGSTDIKGASTYITVSYNHYWDSGKVSLCGLGETEEYFVTYHHNWFDHSDSRHPRIRTGSIHIYNNYYDGISKYGVGVTTGSSAFVEANYFRNTKYPMMSSKQGTDTKGDGTFSKEPGGIIKAYDNLIIGAKSLIYANSDEGTVPRNPTSFDAYLASSRNEIVPSSYKTLDGGTTYNNFDTSVDLGVSKTEIDPVEDVVEIVTTKAGRLNQGDFTWEFNNEVDDSSYDINQPLMNKIRNYSSTIISIGGNQIEDPVDPNDPDDPIDPVDPASGTIVHNFTSDGKVNDFFSIAGKLSTSKGTVNYKGLTLTQCLKIETSTRITFTTTNESELTLVFKESGKRIKVDGISYTTTDIGILNLTLAPGEHTIAKDEVMNLFYMELIIDDSGEEPIDPEEPVEPEDPEEPVDPEDPEEPVEPENPEGPIEPGDPVDPEEPGESEKTDSNSFFKVIIYIASATVFVFGVLFMVLKIVISKKGF